MLAFRAELHGPPSTWRLGGPRGALANDGALQVAATPPGALKRASLEAPRRGTQPCVGFDRDEHPGRPGPAGCAASARRRSAAPHPSCVLGPRTQVRWLAPAPISRRWASLRQILAWGPTQPGRVSTAGLDHEARTGLSARRDRVSSRAHGLPNALRHLDERRVWASENRDAGRTRPTLHARSSTETGTQGPHAKERPVQWPRTSALCTSHGPNHQTPTWL